MSDRRPHFVFIAGAGGSGTTMLLRILGGTRISAAIGGNHISLPKEAVDAIRIVKDFRQTNLKMWDRYGTCEQIDAALARSGQLLDELMRQDELAGVTHVVFKRSFPFGDGDRYRPDLYDLTRLFGQVRVVVPYRDPKAAAYSILRRGFFDHIRQCAIICEEQLTLLSAQLVAIPEASRYVYRYESFCEDPHRHVSRMARVCGLPEGEIVAALDSERVQSDRIDRWRQELPGAEVEFLDAFFDESRIAQWQTLVDASLVGSKP